MLFLAESPVDHITMAQSASSGTYGVRTSWIYHRHAGMLNGLKILRIVFMMSLHFQQEYLEAWKMAHGENLEIQEHLITHFLDRVNMHSVFVTYHPWREE